MPHLPCRSGRPPRQAFACLSVIAALLSVVCPQPAAAQKAEPEIGAAPAGPDPATDDVVLLDPFLVSASEDRESYEATATTAATRIRTDLKDVGSAISVVTSQFLKDTNSHNSQDLLVYTTNTEVGGPGGNFAGLGDGANIDDFAARMMPQYNTRIRGLAAADNTRDFFLTDIAWDSFDTGRIDIQRGPNAILFGLGSPAGIINASTNIASFMNEGSVSFSTGSFGSYRSTLDLNAVLLPQELALRLDTLDDLTDYEQVPAFNHDRRIYGALRWDPKFLKYGSAHTSLRINFEHGNIEANRPHILPPIDQITPWFTALNKIGVDPRTWQNDPSLNSSLGGGGNAGLLAVFANPASSTGTLEVTGGNGASLAQPLDPVDYLPKSSSPAEQFKVYTSSVLQDPSIFDYYDRLIDGPNKHEWEGHNIANATLEQTFLSGRLGIEASYDHQQTTQGATSAGGYSALTVDINTVLPDGSVNPNFGRAYLEGDAFENAVFSSTRDAWRATAFGELRFADFMQASLLTRLLGRHVFTGFWSRERADKEYFDWDAQAADLSFAPYTGDITIDNRLIGDIDYLGPSLAGRASAAGANLPGLSAVHEAASGTINYFDQSAATPAWTTLPLTVISNFDGARGNGNHAQLTEDDVLSEGLVWQGFLWDGLAVPMAGLRRDKDEDYALTIVPKNPDGTVDFASPEYSLPSAPNSVVTGDSTSWGIVVHAPEFIGNILPGHAGFSLFYNQANNFQPQAGRIDVLGNPLPPPTGRSKDYGFLLNLLDDRLTLKVNWYRTDVTNDALPLFGALYALPNAEAWGYMYAQQTLANGGNGVAAMAGGYQPLSGQTAAQAKADGIAIATAFLNPANQPPDSFFALYNIDRAGWPGFIQGGIPPGFTITGDTEAKGTEYELTAEPAIGWNISFNASRNIAESHNLAHSVAAWIEQRWAVFNTPVPGTSLPTVIGDQRIFTPIYQPGATVIDLYRTNIWIPYLQFKAEDGADVSEMRPWRFNFVTDYTFTHGRLKGLKVGGAYRWQDREVVGYPVYPTASATSASNQIFDLAHPYLGPVETNVDLWIGYERRIAKHLTWRLQLNVSNLFAKKDLIPVSVEPDGSMAYGRIPAPRTWTLTNSFSF